MVLATAQRARDRLDRLAAAASDHITFQTQSLTIIGTVVPFDAAIHTSIDPGSLLDTTCLPFGTHHDPQRELRQFELEYRDDAPLACRDLARRPARAAALRLEIDDPHTVPRYNEIIEPNGGHDELRATFVTKGQCWGSLTLYRTVESPPFAPDEVAFFSRISDLMGRGLRNCFLHAALRSSAGVSDPPGHLTVNTDGTILSTSAEAEHWLSTFASEGRVPSVLASLVAALEHQLYAQAIVTGTDGPIALHASMAKGLNDAVGVILERPRPVLLAPVIATAHDLTKRENEVAASIMQGLSTRQIAREMNIAEYTVQDHLKSVFAKVGVATRGELTFELFIRHYLPATIAQSTPGPYGYYLDPPDPTG